MSRVCVKNLPKYVAEDRLRDVFSQKGEITDAKLMRTKDGKSRQFAFIGFQTEHQAEEAIKYFNKSYIDTCKITCEIAHKVGDPNIPRPWSRYSQKMEQKKSIEGGNRIAAVQGLGLGDVEVERKNNKKGHENDDPQLQEFLQVMQPRAKSKLWANDAVIASAADQSLTISNKEGSKEEDRKKSVPVEVESNKSDNHDAELFHDTVNDEIITDMDYFKSRVKKEWLDSESESSEDVDDDDVSNDNANDEDEDKDSPSEKLDIKDDDDNGNYEDRENDDKEVDTKDSDGEILDPEVPSSTSRDDHDDVPVTGRLFVRNLPYTAIEDELEEQFSKFGTLSEVHVVVDKDTKRSRGIAYISYTLPESAARALEELDKSIFQGRLMHVMPAKQKNLSNKPETNGPLVQGSKTFKQRREEERKASEASGDTRAWNSLFMRSDTVVENIARRLGVSKSDLLDREADDLAVRIALGETQVIAETKKALANAGVNVTALEEIVSGKTDGIKRSNRVLLVKNLPFGSSEADLAKMFGKFGSLEKIILPPTKTLAMVVFLEPSEARSAFKGLAYKRYKDVPLYLEWAPSNILSQNATYKSGEKIDAAVGEQDAKRALLEQTVEGISQTDIDPDRTESRSLFVKNLNFKTSDESLQKHLSEQMKQGRILSIKIKKHLKKGKNVSMGFGFIEFDSVETATNICRDLQGTVLDGHALILQLCHAKKAEKVAKKSEKDRSSTKLLVRNVAFEATEKDLRQLFSPFGQIKSLRLPMKFGNHRGFAFVEYVTKQEAQNALEALSSTHLYGRHLVLERAKEGESLEELRARTAAQFTDEQTGFQKTDKLTKKRKQIPDLDEVSLKFQRVTD
uniref:Multiple RNA-binding domain-containing protein 1 isoform X1 n=2 Tax=Rhizophora mucronata TaxID=61149 RepID=A0A2P2MME7_RHIMU